MGTFRREPIVETWPDDATVGAPRGKLRWRATTAAVVVLIVAIGGPTIFDSVFSTLAAGVESLAGVPPARPEPPPPPIAEHTIYDEAPFYRRCLRDGVIAKARPTGSPDEKVDKVAAIIEATRDLKFRSMPTGHFIGVSAFSQGPSTGATDNAKRRERIDRKVSTALGIMEEPRDLDQIAGDITERTPGVYFGGQFTQFFVGAPATDWGGDTEVTVAHELQHALADQRLHLRRYPTSRAKRDEALARRAVAEGDATLTSERYVFSAFDKDERTAYFDDYGDGASMPPETGLAYAVNRATFFPYHEGALYVCRAYRQGGWPRVNRLYRHLPDTTAAILFPDRRAIARQRVPAPQMDGRRWSYHNSQSLGAAELMWLLQAPEGKVIVEDAVAAEWVQGWSAGRIDVWTADDEVALAITLGDNRDPNNRYTLCEILERWYRAGSRVELIPSGDPEVTVMRKGSDVAMLRCWGPRVQLTIAPNAGAAEDLLY